MAYQKVERDTNKKIKVYKQDGRLMLDIFLTGRPNFGWGEDLITRVERSPKFSISIKQVMVGQDRISIELDKNRFNPDITPEREELKKRRDELVNQFDIYIKEVNERLENSNKKHEEQVERERQIKLKEQEIMDRTIEILNED